MLMQKFMEKLWAWWKLKVSGNSWRVSEELVLWVLGWGLAFRVEYSFIQRLNWRFLLSSILLWVLFGLVFLILFPAQRFFLPNLLQFHTLSPLFLTLPHHRHEFLVINIGFWLSRFWRSFLCRQTFPYPLQLCSTQRVCLPDRLLLLLNQNYPWLLARLFWQGALGFRLRYPRGVMLLWCTLLGDVVFATRGLL